jgi:hypothetical protein
MAVLATPSSNCLDERPDTIAAPWDSVSSHPKPRRPEAPKPTFNGQNSIVHTRGCRRHHPGLDEQSTQKAHNCARIACAHPPFYATVLASRIRWLRSADRRTYCGRRTCRTQQESLGPPIMHTSREAAYGEPISLQGLHLITSHAAMMHRNRDYPMDLSASCSAGAGRQPGDPASRQEAGESARKLPGMSIRGVYRDVYQRSRCLFTRAKTMRDGPRTGRRLALPPRAAPSASGSRLAPQHQDSLLPYSTVFRISPRVSSE